MTTQDDNEKDDASFERRLTRTLDNWFERMVAKGARADHWDMEALRTDIMNDYNVTAGEGRHRRN